MYMSMHNIISTIFIRAYMCIPEVLFYTLEEFLVFRIPCVFFYC